MIVYTDKREYAESVLTIQEDWRRKDLSNIEPNLLTLASGLCSGAYLYKSSQDLEGRWTYAFIVEEASSSQFDLLTELSRKSIQFPDGIICLAGMGHNFHGQKGRPWAAPKGNIHLTVYFTPQQKIEHFHVGFPILTAVSLIEAIDKIESLQGRASIKWVNDVLIEGAKVAGFLAHTSSINETVNAAMLGIGLNVETTPQVPPDHFVPKVASLRDFVQDQSICNPKQVLPQLLNCLDKNYGLLLSGKYAQLLDAYRKRSVVIGHKVKVLPDAQEKQKEEIVEGRVKDIGENLELIFEDVQEPVIKGRLILID